MPLNFIAAYGKLLARKINGNKLLQIHASLYMSVMAVPLMSLMVLPLCEFNQRCY